MRNIPKMLKRKLCLLCEKRYKPKMVRQKYCGSTAEKIGCSYQKHLEHKRLQYHRLKLKNNV